MSGFALVKRVLGVDFGQARIGVAVSDELGMLAHPLETVAAKPIDAATKRIAQLAGEKGVEAVVVGLPRHMSGAQGAAAEEVNAFVAKLRPLLRCIVVLWDERLTTTAAHRALRDAGKKTRSTRGVVDQVAAQMILQGYLDSRQGGASGAADMSAPDSPLE